MTHPCLSWVDRARKSYTAQAGGWAPQEGDPREDDPREDDPREGTPAEEGKKVEDYVYSNSKLERSCA